MRKYGASAFTVYLRWRGEHGWEVQGTKRIGGLSPLARGTLMGWHVFILINRFIPASAGNTVAVRLAEMKHTVYPRWRGEHVDQIGDLPVRTGLSPLARGTLSE
ncbi:Domain of uncharacterised function (DUF2825) [Klebsiella variicola]|nr:Domain of uncharacterised function (DUF2825) [Klebsiella variicola]